LYFQATNGYQTESIVDGWPSVDLNLSYHAWINQQILR
jgi:hypothetical protein